MLISPFSRTVVFFRYQLPPKMAVMPFWKVREQEIRW